MFLVENTITQLLGEFEKISRERKNILENLSRFAASHQPSEFIFICTHNSRRSHIAQIWAQTAAAYFNIPDVVAYSGGTDVTAFDRRAVDALRGLGFQINLKTTGSNPHYDVRYSDHHPSFDVFSKKYDDQENPTNGFAAIMTCTHAEENCPVIRGASVRIALPFDDPKEFDGTNLETAKYRERSLEIGREILYAFSKIKTL